MDKTPNSSGHTAQVNELPDRILIVGGVGGTNVGDSFYRAAVKMGMQARILDTRQAYAAPAWRRLLNWHLLGRRPPRLRAFSEQVLRTCLAFRPQVLLTTGLAPLSRQVLDKIGDMGIHRLNFLTDDPWNPAHRARWFMRALPHYDVIYSPRRAMLPDLENAGCRQTHFLPFGYDADLFYPAPEEECKQAGLLVADVVFAGGADADRVPYMRALMERGFDLALYGDYWHRQPGTQAIARGQADVQKLRLALASAKLALCLVRRANRDGSCMRTFEVPAVGTCMLTEDTAEHREIFGKEGEAVLYFDSLVSMLEKARILRDDDALRRRLAESAHRLVTQGGHTYRDRLTTMLAGKGWDDARK